MRVAVEAAGRSLDHASRLTRLLAATGVALATVTCGAPESEPPSDPNPVEQGIFGVAPAAVGGIPSVVSLRPAGGSGAMTGSLLDGTAVPERATIDQFGLDFSPHAILVRVGGTLHFSNSEADITHNVEVVFLDTDSTVLNTDVSTGQSVDLVLEREGGYGVRCEYHPGMLAFAYAASDPAAVLAEADGSFALTAASDRYVLSVWSADPTRRSEQPVTIGAGATEFASQPSG